MANLLQYLQAETRDFSTFPLTDVDNLILSWFAGMPIKAASAHRMGAAARQMQSKVDPESDAFRYLALLSESPRLSDVEIHDYVNEFSPSIEMQFGAVTLILPDGTVFIAFRGTDASLIGWKEDFNMASEAETPGQRRAVEYLAHVSAKFSGHFYVGGHSKGGNLAVYSSIMSPPEIQSRILRIFSNDGPGLAVKAFESDGFQRMRDKITVFLPQTSMVGILLYRVPECRVVKSDAIGPMQHFPCSWQVEGDQFVELEHLSPASLYADRVIKAWMTSVTLEERREFIDSLYRIVAASGANTFSDLFENWRKNGAAILAAFRETDPDTRRFIRRVFALLLSAGARSVRKRNRENLNSEMPAVSMHGAPSGK